MIRVWFTLFNTSKLANSIYVQKLIPTVVFLFFVSSRDTIILKLYLLYIVCLLPLTQVDCCIIFNLQSSPLCNSPFVPLFVCSFVCLFVCLSVYLFVCLFVCFVYDCNKSNVKQQVAIFCSSEIDAKYEVVVDCCVCAMCYFRRDNTHIYHCNLSVPAIRRTPMQFLLQLLSMFDRSTTVSAVVTRVH